MKHFIEHNQYYNELGIPDAPYYRVYTKKKFLGLFLYSSYATETRCGWGDCYNAPIDFKTAKEATEFIKSILCKSIKTETTKRFIIASVDCKK
jgi:hypothetical protein